MVRAACRAEASASEFASFDNWRIMGSIFETAVTDFCGLKPWCQRLHNRKRHQIGRPGKQENQDIRPGALENVADDLRHEHSAHRTKKSSKAHHRRDGAPWKHIRC